MAARIAAKPPHLSVIRESCQRFSEALRRNVPIPKMLKICEKFSEPFPCSVLSLVDDLLP